MYDFWKARSPQEIFIHPFWFYYSIFVDVPLSHFHTQGATVRLYVFSCFERVLSSNGRTVLVRTFLVHKSFSAANILVRNNPCTKNTLFTVQTKHGDATHAWPSRVFPYCVSIHHDTRCWTSEAKRTIRSSKQWTKTIFNAYLSFPLWHFAVFRAHLFLWRFFLHLLGRFSGIGHLRWQWGLNWYDLLPFLRRQTWLGFLLFLWR